MSFLKTIGLVFAHAASVVLMLLAVVLYLIGRLIVWIFGKERGIGKMLWVWLER